MNAPVRELQIAGDIDDFRECCMQHRWFCDSGILALPVAVDNLQWLAERWGLVDQYGQDEIQREIADAIAADLGIHHSTVQEARKVADDPPPDERVGRDGKSYPAVQAPRPYCTPQATVDAFWYVVRAETPDYLANWLASHPRDKAHLHAIWERKCAAAT